MRCPECGSYKTKVTDSRTSTDGSIRRRRECCKCHARFTTYERITDKSICVIKNDGTIEIFERNKLLNGLMRACVKRDNITMRQLETLVDIIENKIRVDFHGQIKSSELGDLVLGELAKLDDVAYIRFASVYKDFKDANEFSEAINSIKKPHERQENTPGF